MDENDFEGTWVLEQLARIDALEEFMAAVDIQNNDKVRELLETAGVDPQTISIVLKKMNDPFDEH